MPELIWLGDHDAKRSARRVPYRLLQPVSAVGEPAVDNLLIQGDNLHALKALLPFYAGRVKCIYIDPPYNTKSAFEHYDDNLEHSQWLSMMYPGLELLRDLLTEDGSIWVSIDDNEGHYLKVLMDEVFGRSAFKANVIWEKADSPRMDAEFFSSRHDHILVYAKSPSASCIRRLTTNVAEHYDKLDEQGRRYYLKPLRAMGGEDSRESRPSMYFALAAPDGTAVLPKRKDGSDGRWRWGLERIKAESSSLEWVKGRGGWTPYYRVFADEGSGRPPETIWSHGEVGSNRTSKAEIKALFGDANSFDTPKPEGLLQRIIAIATDPEDIVLDSVLGSGTTAAVAHKMNRRWIGIEMGEHAQTHCLPRLEKVVKGEQGGISEAIGWKGGGGFRFMKLGEPVFLDDGRISPEVRFASLAAYLWFLETGAPHAAKKLDSPVLGSHGGTSYALLYNGILGDKRPDGGNVLTQAVWQTLRSKVKNHVGPWVIYGEATRLSPARLKALGIVFKQIPYDIRMR
jgi:adenine-specific DNA-methyltransferase